jgi:hypothetical protein
VREATALFCASAPPFSCRSSRSDWPLRLARRPSSFSFENGRLLDRHTRGGRCRRRSHRPTRLNVIQGARLAGANLIVGVDISLARKALAENFGMTHFVNPKEGEGDLVPYLVNLTKGGADYSFEGIVNLMVAGERRLEPRNRWVAYAAVLKAVISAQTSVESYSLRFGNRARESQSARVGIRCRAGVAPIAWKSSGGVGFRKARANTI